MFTERIHMSKKPKKDLNLSECPEGPKEIAFDHIALLDRIDRIEAELREEIRQKEERIATLEAEVAELRELDRLREEELAFDRRRIATLMEEKRAKPSRKTDDRIADIVAKLMQGGNRWTELSSFEFREGRLSKDQIKRIAAHIRQDPHSLLEIKQSTVDGRLLVALAGEPKKPRR